jgi:hypothetical protein
MRPLHSKNLFVATRLTTKNRSSDPVYQNMLTDAILVLTQTVPTMACHQGFVVPTV